MRGGGFFSRTEFIPFLASRFANRIPNRRACDTGKRSRRERSEAADKTFGTE
jgi:hypothetical protein